MVVAAGCARTLPEQDRRITTAIAAVKLSAEDLWKDFQSDQAGASRRYHGKAVEVSGNVTSFTRDRSTNAHVLFSQQKPLGVQADLLDDQAAEILSSLKEGQRLTLKCFCDKLDGNVLLKSCVKP